MKSCSEFYSTWIDNVDLDELESRAKQLVNLVASRGLCAKLTDIALHIIYSEFVTVSMLEDLVDKLCSLQSGEECRDVAKCVRSGLKALEEIGVVAKVRKGLYRNCLYDPLSAAYIEIADPFIRRKSKNFEEYVMLRLLTHRHILIMLAKKMIEEITKELENRST